MIEDLRKSWLQTNPDVSIIHIDRLWVKERYVPWEIGLLVVAREARLDKMHKNRFTV